VINTFVLDSKGRGMSKSKENVVWADELIKKYNVDALRYWVGGASLGSDLHFNEKDLVAGKRFLTKLWNASKFVFMNLKGYNGKKPKKFHYLDKLFLANLDWVSQNAVKRYSNYDIAGAKREIENFFWIKFCDNYLELVKNRIYSGKGDEKLSAQYTLYESLLRILKLISPITPFITEELYQTYFKKTEKIKSIHITKWGKIRPEQKHLDKLHILNSFIGLISRIRKEKSKAKKSVKAPVILTIEKKDKRILKNLLEDLKAVTNASEIKIGKFKVEFK
jgi:valyl-tRNA synthetase